MTEPYGHEALAAFNRANALFKSGRYEEVLAVEMRTSDRELFEKWIAAAKQAGGANRDVVQRNT